MYGEEYTRMEKNLQKRAKEVFGEKGIEFGDDNVFASVDERENHLRFVVAMQNIYHPKNFTVIMSGNLTEETIRNLRGHGDIYTSAKIFDLIKSAAKEYDDNPFN